MKYTLKSENNMVSVEVSRADSGKKITSLAKGTACAKRHIHTEKLIWEPLHEDK